MNSYQLSKARRVADFLLMSAKNTKQETRAYELAQIVARLSEDEWRTVSFAAGVPMCDLPAKAAVLHILRGRAPHVIGAAR